MDDISKTILQESLSYLNSIKCNRKSLTHLKAFPHIYKDYSEITSEDNQILHYCDIFFLISIFVLVTSNFILSLVQEKNMLICIAEGVTVLIMIFFLTIFQFSRRLRSWAHFTLLSGWLLYAIFFLNIIIALYLLSSTKELEVCQFFTNKVFFYFIIGNLSFVFFIKFGISLNLRHLFVVIIFNSGIILFSCILFGTFANEFFSMAAFSFFILTNSYKAEYFNKVLYEEYLKQRVMYLTINGIVDSIKIGYCSIKANFLILKSNEFFSNHLSYLKNHPNNTQRQSFTLKESVTAKDRTSKDANHDTLNLLKTTSHFMDGRKKSNADCKEDLEVEGCYLEVEEIYQKEAYNFKRDENQINLAMLNNNKNRITLKEVIKQHIEYVSNNVAQTSMDFNKLGKFQFNLKGNLFYYDIFFRRNFFKINDSVIEDSYELIFIEIPDDSKKEKSKIEEKYKNLLLAKISHEFKAPIMLIQNIIDGFLTENTYRNASPMFNSTTMATREKFGFRTFVSGMQMVKVHLENLLRIKYLAETILLMVLDLTEYVSLKSTRTDAPLRKRSLSLLSLNGLRDYLIQLGKVYCSIFEKDIQVHVILEDHLENSRIAIDEKKLKQIIANLLSNAVKNTNNRNSITITIQHCPCENPADGIRLTMVKNTHEKDILISDRTSIKDNCCASEKDVSNSDINLPIRSHVRCNTSIAIQPKVFKKMATFNSIKDTELIITLEDSGQGINDTIIQAINNSKRSIIKSDKKYDDYAMKKGLGTGLTICKKLCKELGIEMKCEQVYNNERCAFSSAKILPKTLSFDRSKQIIGTKFILKIHSEMEHTGGLATLTTTRLNTEKDFKLAPHEKQFLKYENDISMEDNKSSVCLSDNQQNYVNDEDDSFIENNVINNKLANESLGFQSKSKNRFLIPESEIKFQILSRSASPRQRMNFSGMNSGVNTLNNNTISLIPIGNFPTSSNVMSFNFGKNERRRPSVTNLFRRMSGVSLGCEYESNDISKDCAEFDNKKLPAFIVPDNCIDTVITENNEGEEVEIKSVKSSVFRKSKQYEPTYTFQALGEGDNPENQDNTNKKILSPYFTKRVLPRGRKFSLDQFKVISNSRIMRTEPIDKIIVVDDNSSNSRAIEKLIQNYYKRNKMKNELFTKTLSDGIDLLYEIYQELKNGTERTKVIFCDQMMEYMHGADAFKIMNNIFIDKKISSIPFVICSSFNDEGHLEKMKTYGIEHVYEKPMNYGNIEFILNSLLKNK